MTFKFTWRNRCWS